MLLTEKCFIGKVESGGRMKGYVEKEKTKDRIPVL